MKLAYILEGDKISFKGSYDEQNRTFLVTAHEIYETGQSWFHNFHMK